MYSKIKIKRKELLLLGLLVISPVLSLIVYFFIKNKYKYNLNFTLIICCLLSFIIPFRSYDLVRHYYSYENINPELNYIDFILKQTDYLMPTLYFLGNKINLKKEFIPFFSLFCSVYFYLQLFYIILKNKLKLTPKQSNTLFLMGIFSLDYRGIIFGVRNIPAILLLLYGFINFMLFREGKKYIFISSMMHIMTLPYVFFIFLFDKLYIPKIKIYKKIFYASFIGLIVNKDIIVSIVEYLPLTGVLRHHLNFYLIGYWSGEQFKDYNLNYVIFLFLNNLKKYYLIIFLLYDPLKKIKGKTKKIYSFVYLTTSFCLFVSSVPSFTDRYSVFPYYLLILVICLYLRDNKINKELRLFIYGLMVVIGINFIGSLYETRQSLIYSYKTYFNFIVNIFYFSTEYKKFL